MNFAKGCKIYSSKNITFQIDFEREVGVGQIEIKVSILCKGNSLDKWKNMVDENYKTGQRHTTGEIREMWISWLNLSD